MSRAKAITTPWKQGSAILGLSLILQIIRSLPYSKAIFFIAFHCETHHGVWLQRGPISPLQMKNLPWDHFSTATDVPQSNCLRYETVSISDCDCIYKAVLKIPGTAMTLRWQYQERDSSIGESSSLEPLETVSGNKLKLPDKARHIRYQIGM